MLLSLISHAKIVFITNENHFEGSHTTSVMDDVAAAGPLVTILVSTVSCMMLFSSDFPLKLFLKLTLVCLNFKQMPHTT